MMIFFDTEFTELRPIFSEVNLISIGLISEDGKRTFYAEFTDSYTLDNCSDFVKQEVLPLLDAPALPEVIDYSAIYAKMTTEQAREYLRTWIEALGYSIRLYSDATQFDWHFVVELFRGHPWPENLKSRPKSCIPHKDLTQVHRYHQITESAFSSGQYRRHHALDDAKVMRLATLESKI